VQLLKVSLPHTDVKHSSISKKLLYQSLGVKNKKVVMTRSHYDILNQVVCGALGKMGENSSARVYIG
jgi:hypothetical protein